jgi:hypothetical protein
MDRLIGTVYGMVMVYFAIHCLFVYCRKIEDLGLHDYEQIIPSNK